MRECCDNPANVKHEQMAPDIEVKTCAVCGRKRYEFSVDPLKIFAKPPENAN